jgi:superfamily II DNA or RNA helicase
MANQSEEKWVMWCNMNAESSALKASINGAAEVTGSDNQDYKEISLLSFSKGEIKVLVTKPRIAGFGMNFQNCSNMAFVGLSDSYEQFYQAVRRCWRFGQPNPVHAHIITGEREGNVVDNIKRKESDASAMFDGMVSHMATFIKKELSGFKQNKTDYTPKIEMKLPAFMEESQ